MMYIHVKRRVDPSIEHEGKVFIQLSKVQNVNWLILSKIKKEAGGGKCDDE